MSIPNAYCKKCDEMEPQDFDSQTDGLWVCGCPRKIVNIDEAIKKVQEMMDVLIH